VLAELTARGVACSPALAFGVSEADGVCFCLLGYIEGECAEEALPGLPVSEQQAIGVQAGAELHRLQHAVAPRALDWHAVRSGKYLRIKAAARELGLAFDGQAQVEHYVEAHLDLMRNRPTTFQHDDFHPGNLVVRDGRLAGVIDFNRCDWGDPWHDLYKIPMFGVPVSPAFARGVVEGYFPDGVPAAFWPLYTLYVGILVVSDQVWTLRNYPQYMDASYVRIREIVETHDFVQGGPPAWFDNR